MQPTTSPNVSSSYTNDSFANLAPSAHRGEIATALIEVCRSCEKGCTELCSANTVDQCLIPRAADLVGLAVKARDAQAYAAWGAALLQVIIGCLCSTFNAEDRYFAAIFCFKCVRKENGLSKAGTRQTLTGC